jgi:hypothetical protein
MRELSVLNYSLYAADLVFEMLKWIIWMMTVIRTYGKKFQAILYIKAPL